MKAKKRLCVNADRDLVCACCGEQGQPAYIHQPAFLLEYPDGLFCSADCHKRGAR